MALDIKKFGVRALTAFVFVAVLLTSLLWNYYAFSFFFFVVAMWGLREFYQLAERLGYSPYKIVGLFAGTFLYVSFTDFTLLAGEGNELELFKFLPAVLPILLAFSIFDTSKQPLQNALFTAGGLIYAVLPFGLVHKLVVNSDDFQPLFEPRVLLGIILLIWSNDTFAYLGGSLFGKNKMIERVSPGKTWEGTVIGVLLTFALSFLLPQILMVGSDRYWALCGILVPVLATLGDLLESVIKRQAGVKDTGNIMPGHGGILDRFDSLIFVSPFAVVLAQIMF